MSEKFNNEIAMIGIDIGKNSFHIVGQDRRGSIVLRQKWSRGKWKRGLPTYRHASSAWRHALGRITSVASFRRLAMMPG